MDSRAYLIGLGLLRYQTAATIILVILALVITVEQLGGWLRRKII